MKAIVRGKYGSPDVLRLEEVERPVPLDNEVLLQVHAASVNALDWHLLRGKPFVARIGMGLFKPKSKMLGADVAGRVESVGKDVKQFSQGDEVFGTAAASFVEYAVARENNLALKPRNLTFEESAAVPVAAITALQGLRDTGKIHAGQKVLVNGASGGVGTFAVQIAKSFDTEVTGVCSTRNLEIARSIGADHVIDYTKEDFTINGEGYDLILDVAGNRSVSDYKHALKVHGICVITGFSSFSRLIEHIIMGKLLSTKYKKVGLMGVAKINQKDLIVLKELIETGKVKPVIDRRYPLSETSEAIRYLEEGHARGKSVIMVEHGSLPPSQGVVS